MHGIWRHLRLYAWDYILDGGALVVLAAVAGRDINTYLRDSGPPDNGFHSFLTFQITFAVTAIWLQLRMGNVIAELSRRERREELALTLLPAREYLPPRIWPRAFRVLFAPAIVSGAIFLVLLGHLSQDRVDEKITLTLTGFLLGVSALSLSVGAVFDLLARGCRRSGAGAGAGSLPFYFPLVWGLLALGATYGVFAGLIAFSIFWTPFDEDVVLGLALVLSILVVPLSMFFAWRRAVRACADYYRFD